jgi:anthranilate phosphoribosyltransferase
MDAAFDIKSALAHLSSGAAMDEAQARRLFAELLAGRLSEAQIGAVLGMMAVRVEGLTVDELVGAGRIMREHVTAVPLPEGYVGPVLDTCGTGGTPKTFNISTAAAIVAAAGARMAGGGATPRMLVAKHGNRSRSGRGSAEVLEVLGIKVDAPTAVQTECLKRVGVCFCFAVHHHPAMKHVSAARQSLGFPTIFNLLGPLTNPARADRQVMGVFADRYVEPMAEALRRLGATKALVFHSRDGMDELSVSAPTRIAEVSGGSVRVWELDPVSLGVARSPRADLEVSTLDEAAEAVRGVLSGHIGGGKRDAVLLAAAAALVVTDVSAGWAEGLELAARAVDSGESARILAELAETSRQRA